MPGGRPILGRDVRAALERFGPPGASARALRARLADHEALTSYEDLLRRCPPESMGMSSGAHAALFAPLFGEFE